MEVESTNPPSLFSQIGGTVKEVVGSGVMQGLVTYTMFQLPAYLMRREILDVRLYLSTSLIQNILLKVVYVSYWIALKVLGDRQLSLAQESFFSARKITWQALGGVQTAAEKVDQVFSDVLGIRSIATIRDQKLRYRDLEQTEIFRRVILDSTIPFFVQLGTMEIARVSTLMLFNSTAIISAPPMVLPFCFKIVLQVKAINRAVAMVTVEERLPVIKELLEQKKPDAQPVSPDFEATFKALWNKMKENDDEDIELNEANRDELLAYLLKNCRETCEYYSSEFEVALQVMSAPSTIFVWSDLLKTINAQEDEFQEIQFNKIFEPMSQDITNYSGAVSSFIRTDTPIPTEVKEGLHKEWRLSKNLDPKVVLNLSKHNYVEALKHMVERYASSLKDWQCFKKDSTEALSIKIKDFFEITIPLLERQLSSNQS